MSNVLSLFIRTVVSTILRAQALDTKLAMFIRAKAAENKIFTFPKRDELKKNDSFNPWVPSRSTAK